MSSYEKHRGFKETPDQLIIRHSMEALRDRYKRICYLRLLPDPDRHQVREWFESLLLQLQHRYNGKPHLEWEILGGAVMQGKRLCLPKKRRP